MAALAAKKNKKGEIEMKKEGYDGIIKDINDKDTDMPTIMFNSQKNLGKAIWQPCKINNQDYLEMKVTLVND